MRVVFLRDGRADPLSEVLHFVGTDIPGKELIEDSRQLAAKFGVADAATNIGDQCVFLILGAKGTSHFRGGYPVVRRVGERRRIPTMGGGERFCGLLLVDGE